MENRERFLHPGDSLTFGKDDQESFLVISVEVINDNTVKLLLLDVVTLRTFDQFLTEPSSTWRCDNRPELSLKVEKHDKMGHLIQKLAKQVSMGIDKEIIDALLKANV